MQLKIANAISVLIRFLYLIWELSQWKTYNQKHFDERKQKYEWQYPGNVTITKHSPPDALKEGEMCKKQIHDKRCRWNHRSIDKEELQQRNRLGMVSSNTTGASFNYFYIYFAFNSVAVPNYKYMFGPQRDLYLICEKDSVANMKQEHKKTKTRTTMGARPQSVIVRHRQSKTDRGMNRYFVWGPLNVVQLNRETNYES